MVPWKSFVTVFVSSGWVLLAAETLPSSDATVPQSLPDGQFDALVESSPFNRSLNLSDTLVLTGVAKVDGNPVATLIDTEDGHTMAISEIPNDQGWKMVEIRGIDDLEAAVATITVGSGEVMQIRYDDDRIKSTNQRLKFKARARAQIAAAKAKERSGLGSSSGHGVSAEKVAMLKRIEERELPEGYRPGAGRNNEESHNLHQNYVDRRLAGMSDRQRGRVGQLWREKQALEPQMPNRGASFVRIMEHVAENEPR